MSYNPFNTGEQLNPDKINTKLEQVNKLLSKAYIYNNTLRKRMDALNIAFSLANSELSGGTANSSTAYHNLPVGASGQEILIGGKHFTDNYANTNLSTVSINQLVDDSYNLVLDNTNTISRLPMSPNEYGELYPSLGTEITCSDTDIDDTVLWNIISPDTIWADTGSNSTITIEFDVPVTLTPLLNKITINPIAGTSYKIQYNDFSGVSHFVDPLMSGNWISGKETFYIDGDKFAGTLSLQLKGTYVGSSYSFGVAHLAVLFKDYVSSGESVLEINNLGATSDKNLTYLNANLSNNPDLTNEDVVIAISSATGAAFDNNIIYDSTLHQYPLTTQSLSIHDSNSPTDTVYLRVSMNKKENNTPVLKDITIRYQEV